MGFLPNLLASSAAFVQAANVEINTHESQDAWYTHPIWLVIGVIVFALIIVLISMAGRRNNTTVVK